MAISGELEKTKRTLNVLNNEVLSKLGIEKCKVCTGDCPGCPVAEIAKKAALDPDFARKLMGSDPVKSIKIGLSVSNIKLSVKPEQYKQMTLKAKGPHSAIEVSKEEVRENESENNVKKEVKSAKEHEQEKSKEKDSKQKSAPTITGTEYSTKSKTDSEYVKMSNVVVESIKSTQAFQLSNLNDLYRYQQQLLSRQNAMGQVANIENSFAAKNRLTDSTNIFANNNSIMQQQAAANANHANSSVQSQMNIAKHLAAQVSAAKATVLINKSIHEVSNILSAVSKNMTVERKITTTSTQTDALITSRKQDQKLLQVEKSMEVLARYIWEKNQIAVPVQIQSAIRGIKIVNASKPEVKQSILHKEFTKETLQSARRTLKLMQTIANGSSNGIKRGRKLKTRLKERNLVKAKPEVRKLFKKIANKKTEMSGNARLHQGVRLKQATQQKVRKPTDNMITRQLQALRRSAPSQIKPLKPGLRKELFSSPNKSKLVGRLERLSSSRKVIVNSNSSDFNVKTTTRVNQVNMVKQGNMPRQMTGTFKTVSKKAVPANEIKHTVQLKNPEIKQTVQKRSILERAKKTISNLIVKIAPPGLVKTLKESRKIIVEILNKYNPPKLYSKLETKAAMISNRILPGIFKRKAVNLKKSAKLKLKQAAVARDAIKKLFHLAWLDMLKKQKELEEENKIKEKLKFKKSKINKKHAKQRKENYKELVKSDDIDLALEESDAVYELDAGEQVEDYYKPAQHV